jgi:hypothetical protein
MDNTKTNNLTETNKSYYVGIGVRSTPADIQSLMTQMAEALAAAGVILRSGHTPGAMMAFEAGVSDSSLQDIYLPYEGYGDPVTDDGHHKVINQGDIEEAKRIAAKSHPRWDSYSDLQKTFLIRNAFIVLGSDLRTPAEFMICYSEDTALGDETSHAITIATKVANMAVFNLAVEGDFERLMAYMEQRG